MLCNFIGQIVHSVEQGKSGSCYVYISTDKIQDIPMMTQNLVLVVPSCTPNHRFFFGGGKGREVGSVGVRGGRLLTIFILRTFLLVSAF